MGNALSALCRWPTSAPEWPPWSRVCGEAVDPVGGPRNRSVPDRPAGGRRLLRVGRHPMSAEQAWCAWPREGQPATAATTRAHASSKAWDSHGLTLLKKNVVIYEGPSQRTGDPILVVASGKTSSRKIGAMVQLWILTDNLSPLEAGKAGADRARSAATASCAATAPASSAPAMSSGGARPKTSTRRCRRRIGSCRARSRAPRAGWSPAPLEVPPGGPGPGRARRGASRAGCSSAPMKFRRVTQEEFRRT